MSLPRRGNFGFTLIELLIAVCLVILIGALVLPSLTSMSDSTRFRSACDQLSSAASVCRAEAKRTGKPVAVGIKQVADGRQALVSLTMREGAMTVGEGEDAARRVDQGKVLMYMPSGFSVDTASQRDSMTTEAIADTAIASTTLPVEIVQTSKSLIIFWAGGGATINAPIVVRGPGGRLAGAKVNSWTGALSIHEQSSDGDLEAEARARGTGLDDIGSSGP